MDRAVRCVSVGAFCLLLSACGDGSLRLRPNSGADTPATVGAYKVGQPYQIDGVYYYPRVDYNYSETGVASWYGAEFNGKRTANGERYDMNALSAAHRTLPMPSAVRVTNLENGRSIALRVNDRGPFARGRIIDVSRRAAQLLGFLRQGTARVRVEIMPGESRRLAMLAKRGVLSPSERIAATPSPPPEIQTQRLPAEGEPRQVAVNEETGPSNAPSRAVNGYRTADIGTDTRVELRPVRPTHLYVQAGSFVEYMNAARLRVQLERYARARVTEARVGNERFFRVRLGPVDNVEAADELLDQVVASGFPQARLIVD